MAHDEGAICLCSNDHQPNPRELHSHHIWPLYAGGLDTPSNRVWICPTSHVNVHELLAEYGRQGGEPPWSYRRHFGGYVRDLAATGWKAMLTPVIGVPV